jgi:hypothetical protein
MDIAKLAQKISNISINGEVIYFLVMEHWEYYLDNFPHSL